MSAFDDRTGGSTWHGWLSGIGFVLAGVFLAAWSLAVLAVMIVPAMLIAAVAARSARRLRSQENERPHRSPHPPIVIEGEYEVINSGPGEGWRPDVGRKPGAGAQSK